MSSGGQFSMAPDRGCRGVTLTHGTGTGGALGTTIRNGLAAAGHAWFRDPRRIPRPVLTSARPGSNRSPSSSEPPVRKASACSGTEDSPLSSPIPLAVAASPSPVSTTTRPAGWLRQLPAGRLEPRADLRPDAVAGRGEFGHWEADPVHFRQKFGPADVTTLVERLSRFVVLRNAEKRARPMMAQIAEVLRPLPRTARRSVTFDRGPEFVDWPHLQSELGAQPWFCDPRRPSPGSRSSRGTACS